MYRLEREKQKVKCYNTFLNIMDKTKVTYFVSLLNLNLENSKELLILKGEKQLNDFILNYDKENYLIVCIEASFDIVSFDPKDYIKEEPGLELGS